MTAVGVYVLAVSALIGFTACRFAVRAAGGDMAWLYERAGTVAGVIVAVSAVLLATVGPAPAASAGGFAVEFCWSATRALGRSR